MNEIIFTVDDSELGLRLDKFLTRNLPEYSRVQLQEFIKTGAIRVNDSIQKPATKLDAGDVVVVQLPDEEETVVIPQAMPLDILYEDEYLLAIHKPAGLVVHPGYGNQDQTLVNALLARYPHMQDFPEPERAGIVHRLDKDTSGVLLVALTLDATDKLIAQFHDRTVEKTYLALVERHPKTESGRIDAPIGRDPRKRKQMTVIASGKPAVSEYRVKQYFETHALLEVRIETGRTHQIRVHLAFIGCPVVGDKVYGPRKQSIKLSRQFLHAQSIAFQHPITDEAMLIEAPLPEKLGNILKKLEAEADY